MSAQVPPSVRLAWFELPAVDITLSPTVRLAHKVDGQGDGQGDGCLTGVGGNDVPVPRLLPHQAPALLVSYVYVELFLRAKATYTYRDWVMDSGAFSAHNSGTKIELNAYVDKCLELMASDPTLTEVFALDEIPKSQDPKDVAQAVERSARNTEEMWRQGVPAVPCYHCGEPEEVLLAMAAKYPKLALGGMVNKGGGSMPQEAKFLWLEQCFSRVWPKKVHGFGVSAPRMVFGLPFHSVDATNWEIGPCAFGNWQKFGAMSVRGSAQDLRSQVRHYLDMEAKARVRWRKEMALLESLPAVGPELGKRARAAAVAAEPAKAKAPKAEPVAAAPEPKRQPVLEDRWANWRPS